MFPEAGKKLGPYEILGELGGGGMARVFRAWDGRLHREVAIKVIDDRYSMPGIRERFMREARAASGLNHANICTIFDIGEQDDAPYLVMELLEGETLRSRIGEGSLPADEILRHGAEIADALVAAHSRGIIHRDIKPANIFLVKKQAGASQAKVLDFGLAKIEQFASEERDFGPHLTSMGATVGTVSYMSPEQARGEKLDARSDLFSLGIVMYEMATGTLPFKGATSALVFVQLLGLKAPEPVRKLNGQIPIDLEEVIAKLLAKSPRARFQTATELRDELQELAERRSSWLTRMKAPPAVIPSPVDLLPAVQNGLPQVDKAAPRLDVPRQLWEGQESLKQTERILPARPGDPQGVRAFARKRRDSSEQRRIEAKKDSRELSAASDDPGGRPSGQRPVRTSIATSPRTTYPAVAPYMPQSSAHHAVFDPAKTIVPDEVLDGTSPTDATAPFGVSRERAAARFGARPAAPERDADDIPRAAGDGELDGEFGEGLGWTWIALLVVLVLLGTAFAAWRMGWLGGLVSMQLLIALPVRGARCKSGTIETARERALYRRAGTSPVVPSSICEVLRHE